MQITIFRHGKPKIGFSKMVSPRDMHKWIDSYNASGICESNKPSGKAIEAVGKSDVVVCSDLPRSIESAKVLSQKNVLSFPEFREIGLPYASWGFPVLPPKIWTIVFRVIWFFGYSANSENMNAAKIRAIRGVTKLEALAKEHGAVVLVGHGIINRLIVNELMLRGWLGPKDPGRKYWDFDIYSKE